MTDTTKTIHTPPTAHDLGDIKKNETMQKPEEYKCEEKRERDR